MNVEYDMRKERVRSKPAMNKSAVNMPAQQQYKIQQQQFGNSNQFAGYLIVYTKLFCFDIN